MSPMAATASGMSPPAAEALDRASGDEHPHRGREAADDRPCREERDAEQEERTTTVDVGELAVERDRHGRAEHVRGEHPRVVLESAQVVCDLRKGGGDDRLVERCEQHAEHEAEEDDQGAALAERIDGAIIHFVT